MLSTVATSTKIVRQAMGTPTIHVSIHQPTTIIIIIIKHQQQQTYDGNVIINITHHQRSWGRESLSFQMVFTYYLLGNFNNGVCQAAIHPNPNLNPNPNPNPSTSSDM